MKLSISTSYGLYRYNFKPLYWGIKPINKVIAKENLLLVKQVLDQANLHFVLYFGTLLGAVREKDFITHDEDIDLVMYYENLQLFLDQLFVFRDLGFEVARYEKRGFLSLMRKGEYIDFYFYRIYERDARLRCCIQNISPAYFIEETTSLNFMGEDFQVPKQTLLCVEHLFGKDWKVPIKMFDFSPSYIKRMSNYAMQYIKIMIPSSLLYWLQKYKDKSLIEKTLKDIETMQLLDEKKH